MAVVACHRRPTVPDSYGGGGEVARQSSGVRYLYIYRTTKKNATTTCRIRLPDVEPYQISVVIEIRVRAWIEGRPSE